MSGITNIQKIPELQRRILITLLLLIVYRIGVHIPTPGIDGIALAAFFERSQGSLLGLFDMFAGGALSQFSVFALGIMPYISASIILQLLTVAVPHLEKLSKEGEAGRKKITQYTRYGTVVLSIIQGFGISVGLEGMSGPTGIPIVFDGGWDFRFMTTITLTSGTVFLMWLGEQITERGIGNGISLIIFAGIVCRIPAALLGTFSLLMAGELGIFFILALSIFMIAVMAIIVFVEGGQRRIPIQYAKRMVGRKLYGGQTTHLPLRVNTAGVIPAIFASSLIMFPATIVNFVDNQMVQVVAHQLLPGKLLYEVLFVGFIIFFCYFYTAVMFNPKEVSENIKKYGGYIPGIRPGAKTAEYIDFVLSRITLGGALYISAICVLPSILISYYNVPFYFGGTALLIVVGVALDTAGQIETHMLSRQYEGIMKKQRLARRR